ncbi:21578_t:CDS:1, partial [Gigaspora rosea]
VEFSTLHLKFTKASNSRYGQFRQYTRRITIEEKNKESANRILETNQNFELHG